MTASGSSIIADRRGCTGVSVKPTGTPRESSNRLAGSTVTRRVLRPCLARCSAMAAEQVVLPTPPLPTTMTRFLPSRPCTAAATRGSGMKAATPPMGHGLHEDHETVFRGIREIRGPVGGSVAADQREVWTAIADSFDRTRQRPWPHVVSFLEALPKGSRVLDLMGGNGR